MIVILDDLSSIGSAKEEVKDPAGFPRAHVVLDSLRFQ